ncbi:hypothetical protein M948_11080 [Virgibacillus sp. CM-4]|nr:hypothetical protein M948_11080 [Virgibacillus sp. CM-4]
MNFFTYIGYYPWGGIHMSKEHGNRVALIEQEL